MKMIDFEESEAVFYIEAKGPHWGGEKRSKLRLSREENIVIENPPRCGFAAKKPLIIPYELLLTVYTKFSDNLQNRRRIFDTSHDVKVPAYYLPQNHFPPFISMFLAVI